MRSIIRNNHIKFVLAILFLQGCSPRDVHIKTMKERLNEGEVIVYKSNGNRPETCQQDKSDWSDLRVYHLDYENFVLGHFQAFVRNGYQNCFRIGSRVYADTDRKKLGISGALGYADIESVAIMSLDQLKEKRTLVAKGSADLEQFDSTVQRMEKDQKPSHQGMVNVTFVSYVPGSSAMETVYKDKEQKLIQEKKERAAFAEEDNSIKENNLDKIINSLKEGKVFSVQNTGQRLPTCEDVNYIEKEFWIHKSEYSSLKERTLRTKIDKRIENCHEVGEVLPISVSNTPSKDKVKIISMHLLTLESLKANTNLIQGEEAQSKLNTNIERLEKELKDKEIKVIQLINVDYLGEQ